MAIDDSTNYTLTGAQVKDLAARIKAKTNAGLVLYANYSLHTPTSITDICTDSGLTTSADPTDIIAAISAGGSVVIQYSIDEAVVVTSYDDHTGMVPDVISFTGQFLSNWKTNSPEFIKFIYSNTLTTWSAETVELPTVNDATLTIQKNGTDVQTFTANQSTNATANIIVPTQFSDLSGTIGTSQIADGAVTSGKIDWTSSSGGILKTVSDQNGSRTTMYFGDGTMITTRRWRASGKAMSSQWGGLYYWDLDEDLGLHVSGYTDFISQPTILLTPATDNTQGMWLSAWEYSGASWIASGGGYWGLKAGSYRFLRPTTAVSANVGFDIVAIGRWKA